MVLGTTSVGMTQVTETSIEVTETTPWQGSPETATAITETTPTSVSPVTETTWPPTTSGGYTAEITSPYEVTETSAGTETTEMVYRRLGYLLDVGDD